MIRNCLLLSFFGILAYFSAGTVATEAIIGGLVAGSDQFPYQVSVMVKQENICGGGLVSDQHVLTAAHCVIDKQNNFKNFTDMKVLAGANNLKSRSVRALTVAVETAYVPVKFTNPPENSRGDIAVIKLIEAFKRDSVHRYLKLLTLPRNHNLYAGKTAKIAGFGWDYIITENHRDFGRNNDNFLHYSDSTILSNQQCHRDYPEHKHLITDKHLCAQVRQHVDTSKLYGVCVGDSGSPLVINQTLVVAVLSTGPNGCTERETSAIYTRVSHYVDFIYHAVRGRYRKDIRTP